jgi:hypothetical protein
MNVGRRIMAMAMLVSFGGDASADRAGGITADAGIVYQSGEPPDAVALTLSTRLVVDRRYAAAIQLRGGATRNGFAYEAVLSPLGVAVRIGRSGDVGVLAGGGVSGVTGSDFAAPIAVVGFAEAELTRKLRVAMFSSVSWLAFASSRDAQLAAVGADELSAGMAARIGRRLDEYNGFSALGLRVAISWKRTAQGDAAMMSLGVGLDVGWLAEPATFP